MNEVKLKMLRCSLKHFVNGQWILVICLLLSNFPESAAKTFPVHWNISNPIFRIDNTDNIFDVYVGNSPSEYDQANILCPFYSLKEGNSTLKEEYIIYSVSREEYETCHIVDPNPRIVAECKTPHRQLYFTITFRTFTPSPGAMEFKPGQDYFFISTSDPDNLHRRSGGRCSSHNMKVVFKTAERRTNANQQNDDYPNNRGHHIRPATSLSDLAKSQGDVATNVISKIVTRDEILHSNQRPSIQKIDPNFYLPVRQESFSEDQIKLGTDKKSFDEDHVKLGSNENEVYSNFRRHSPNNAELVKQEASRMANHGKNISSGFWIVIITTLLIMLQ